MNVNRRLLVALLVMLLALPPCTVSSAPTRSSVSAFVEPQSHTAPVLRLIRAARHSIRLEVYLLTSRTIIGALGKARAQGIDVRVLLEQHPYGADRYAQLGYSELQQAGVPVRWANEAAFTYTHEKSMVVDGTVAGIFTFNLTSSGLLTNREFGVVDTNARDAATIAAVFDADWARRSYRPNDPALAISPVTSRPAIDGLIAGSRHTLDLYQEEIDDLGVESYLERAARRHVRVRLIISADSPGVDALRNAGVQVKIMPHPYVHAKTIVADVTRAFVGSENISTTSLDHNREMGIVTNDPGVIRTVESTFTSDWSGGGSAPAPPPSTGKRGGFGVRVTADPPSVRRGQSLTIRASTSPGATCRIQVTYPDGYVSRSRSLAAAETAGSDGTVSWTWHVGSTASGTSHAAVTCMLNGRTSSGATTFTIA